jgi:ketosteroid isomerase-like protein
MTRFVSLVLLLAASLYGAEPSDDVRQTAEGWYRAAVKQDAAALNKLLSDDLTYCHAGGKMQTKSEYIAAVMNGPSHYESMTFTDMKIRLYGKTAILTGSVDVKLTNAPVFSVRTLHVYVENNGQWQLAAHESTRLGK